VEKLMNLTPFLLFDGDCAEAMAFYQACLGGELAVTKVDDSPMNDLQPPEPHSKVAHAHLKSRSMEFSATDWQHETRRPSRGNTVAMYLNSATYEQLREVFDKLSAGAGRFPLFCNAVSTAAEDRADEGHGQRRVPGRSGHWLSVANGDGSTVEARYLPQRASDSRCP
jgi:PhnB protein